MYLKTLDIQGFKSFPNKLKLEFNKGITAIVGPNGSGKSNISDAVRWVLGEQSAKNLRGSKMEDIIFTGTENRKPLGFAEVSITLDNVEKLIPIEFSEVTITRRVYRSGESEYQLNGVSCRLKDIYELFTDTGIGKEGYSIIGQGRIDEILSTKSEDRRNMFEEAAGILKFKNRREEAKIKLEKERQNLMRVNDIISTLKEQVEPLKIQADQAKKYLQLRESLKLIEINMFITDAEKIEKDIAIINNSFNISSNQLDQKKKDYEKSKENQHNLKKELEELNYKFQDMQKQVYDSISEIEKNQSTIKLIEEQINHTSQDIKRIQDENQKKSDKIHHLNKDKDMYLVKSSSLDLQLKTQRTLLDEKQNKFHELSTNLNENETFIENYNNEIVEKIRELADIKSNIQNSELIISQVNEKILQLNKEKNYNLNQIEDKNLKIEEFEKSKNESTDIELKISNSIKKVSYDKLLTQKSLETEKNNLNELNSKLGQCQLNYNYLNTNQKQHRGFSESVKNVLKAKENNNNQWIGIYGVIGEIINVPKKYEIAIEIALGSNINNIITDSEKDAQMAIKYLKETKGGRATFLPLSVIRAKYLDKEKLNSQTGVLGIASDIIKYDMLYDNIIKNLLGKVIIMDNLNNAIILSNKYGYSYKIVTIDGDIINPGGALTGGSRLQTSTNIFGTRRQIDELSNEMVNLKKNIEKKKLDIKILEDTIKDYEDFMIDKNKEYQDNHLRLISLEKNIEQILESVYDINNKQQCLYEEEIEINLKKTEISKLLYMYKEKLINCENSISNIQNKLNEFQSNIQSDKIFKEELINTITEAKVQISSLEQEKNSCNDNILRIENEIENFNREISFNTTQINSLNIILFNKVEQIKDIKNNIDISEEKCKVKQENIKHLEEMKKCIAENLENIDIEIEEQINNISLLEKEVIRIENQKSKLNENKDNLYNNMWNEYEVTYNSAKEYKNEQLSYSQLQKENKSLKENIKKLGDININAIQQYKTINERFEFLISQRDDIVETEEKLQNIIQDLTQAMGIQFIEQFKIISDNFSEVFIDLFGGGKAYLKLSDNDNILESGIDIIAQPPGKKLQNMMLLSGGERALTAIALLFAILKLKPSPFCILDEIEAALDDANVNRYAQFLKKFSKVTQFIVVTHRKGTMECADTLYGVTMQEQGVSKLVSVRFEENPLV